MLDEAEVPPEGAPKPSPSSGLAVLDGDAILRWGLLCVDSLARRCDEINDLNVFPVPDSDTGTNLLFTMRAAIDSVGEPEAADRTASQVTEALARAATRGARGNSGLFASQVLRGFANAARGLDELDAPALRAAFRSASDSVRAAVSQPVEGTIVTVVAAAALSAQFCNEDSTLAEIAIAAADGAVAALERTPILLQTLEEAGVVDSGGLGLVVMLDALTTAITGTAVERPHYVRGVLPHQCADDHDHAASNLLDPGHARSTNGVNTAVEQDYEVMYLVTSYDTEAMAKLRADLNDLGDSVLVVGDGKKTWSIHVHCRDAGAAIEAGLRVGHIRSVRVNSFAVERARAIVPNQAGVFDRGVLSVVEGDEAAALFESEGAVVLRGDHGVDSDTLLAAITAMVTREVLVLPNGSLTARDLVAVGVAARDKFRDVLLLPSSSMVQGLASLAVHDPTRLAVDDAFAMSEASGATRWGSVRRAHERALTVVGTCKEGDGLGLIQDEVVVIEPDPLSAAQALLERVLGLGGELVTILLGADPEAPTIAAQLATLVRQNWAAVEVVVYPAGQSTDVLQFGVE